MSTQKQKLFSILQILILITLICWVVWLTMQMNSQPKIAYVKSIYLVEKYEGTKEAYQKLQMHTAEWQANLDSLESIYKEAYQDYEQQKDNLSTEKLKQVEQDLLFKQTNLTRYQKIIQEKHQKEDQELTKGIYAQIDSYLKEYAKQQGYDLVIGANAEGTVLYGNNALDITDQVLEIINAKYQGRE